MKKVLPLIFIPLLSFGQVPADKQKHFFVGGGIGIITSEIVTNITHDRRTGTYAGIAMAAGIGLLKEIADSREANNRFDGVDLAATALGGAMFSISIDIFANKKPLTRGAISY